MHLPARLSLKLLGAAVLMAVGVVFASTATPDTSLPDLQVQNFWIPPLTELTAGTLVNFVFEVDNFKAPFTTPATFQNRLRLDVGNDGTWDVTPPNISIPALGNSIRETRRWEAGTGLTWAAVAGTHKAEVCVDSGSEVAETDETNNCKELIFTITGPTATTPPTSTADTQPPMSSAPPTVVADTQRPETPTGLTVGNVSATNATLTWVTPSDNVGVARFDIRYRVGTTMTPAEWDVAYDEHRQLPMPRAVPAPGTPYAFTFDENILLPGTTYAFAVRACDAAVNCSPVTAVTFRTTGTNSPLAAPTPLATPAPVVSLPSAPVAAPSGGGAGSSSGGGSTAQPATPATSVTPTPATPAQPSPTATPIASTLPTTPETSQRILTAEETEALIRTVVHEELRNLQIEKIKEGAPVILLGIVRVAEEKNIPRDTSKEQIAEQRIEVISRAELSAVAPENKQVVQDAMKAFIAYGAPTKDAALQPIENLGEGERAGVVNSFKEAFNKLPETPTDWEDVLKIAAGRFPSQSNPEREQEAEAIFKKVYRRDPTRTQPNDNACVAVISYGLRPETRRLEAEQVAIQSFQAIYGKNPVNASDWDTVRCIAYSGATR